MTMAHTADDMHDDAPQATEAPHPIDRIVFVDNLVKIEVQKPTAQFELDWYTVERLVIQSVRDKFDGKALANLDKISIEPIIDDETHAVPTLTGYHVIVTQKPRL